MTVEVANFISQLDASYPASGDAKAEGDNHLRLIKAAVKGSFPNLTAAPVTPTTNDLNTLANAATTGAAGLKLVKPAIGSNDTQAASTAFVSEAVETAVFNVTLPSQSGNAGKVIKTDGVYASWQEIAPAVGSTIFLATNFGSL